MTKEQFVQLLLVQLVSWRLHPGWKMTPPTIDECLRLAMRTWETWEEERATWPDG